MQQILCCCRYWTLLQEQQCCASCCIALRELCFKAVSEWYSCTSNQKNWIGNLKFTDTYVSTEHQLLTCLDVCSQGAQQDLGQRVVVTPDQAFPLHCVLLTLHSGSRIQPGQILWCSQYSFAWGPQSYSYGAARTVDTDLSSFLQRVEHHRCVCCTTANMALFRYHCQLHRKEYLPKSTSHVHRSCYSARRDMTVLLVHMCLLSLSSLSRHSVQYR